MARPDSGSSGAGLSIFALILGLLLMAGAAGAYFLGPRLLGDSGGGGVSLTTPAELAGLKLSDQDPHIQLAEQVRASLAAGVPDATDTAAAAYWNGADSAKVVVVAAASVEVSSPAEQLDALFGNQSSDTFTIEERHDVSAAAGPDGAASCAPAKAQSSSLIACAWADTDSVGAVFLYGRTAEEADQLFPLIKAGVVAATE